MIDLRIGLSLVTGFGVGALGALGAVHAAVSAVEAAALAAAALAVAGLGFAAALWLEAADGGRSREPNGALVVFLLFAALGVMLGAGGHAAH